MRLSRLLAAAPVALAAALAACRDDDVTTTTRPPLAGVRYIHAVNDTARLDFRMVDQLEYSANTIAGQGGILFREGTEYFPVEAKARHIRVFSMADTLISTVQQAVHDTTITFEANKNYTLLFTGSTRGNTDRFQVIEEAPPATVAAGQIAMRVYNLSGAAVDAYLVRTDTSSIAAATPAFSGVAGTAASAYVARDTGTVAVRVTSAGTKTVLGSIAAARGALGTTLINPVAGSASPGTVFTAFVFPASVTGSRAPQADAFRTAGVQLFVDRLPANTIGR